MKVSKKQWVKVLKRCIDKRWKPFSEGKTPKISYCEACNTAWGCQTCPLYTALHGCCDGLYQEWDCHLRQKKYAKAVLEYIKMIRKQLMKRGKKHV